MLRIFGSRRPDAPERSLAKAPGEADLFRVSGPEDGACVCNDWLGAVVSLHGLSQEYPALSEAVLDGLFHEGCRHSLVQYDPDEVPASQRAHAVFCSKLAKDTMNRRLNANGVNIREAFIRLYEWARRVDSAGATTGALVQCESALAVLRRAELFETHEQSNVERALRARIATIRNRMGQD